MKLDVFNHIIPKAYGERMLELVPAAKAKDMHKRIIGMPSMVDLEERFRVMDRFDDYAQVVSIPAPPIEALGGPAIAAELARIANDGMAELVAKYPQRFPGFIAVLPMNDPDGLLKEASRAVDELGAVGVHAFANVNGRPLTDPETMPLFDLMAKIDLPIWIHPVRGADVADFKSERKSHYEIWWTLGWPYETSAAMAHIVFAGLFDKHPNLKIITHHLGGIVPFLEGRLGPGWDQLGSRTSDEDYTVLLKTLKKRPLDYFRMFYGDTVTFGASAALRCGIEFFGAEHVLFATDMPMDREKGAACIRMGIEMLDELPVTGQERKAIYEGNARRLLKLA